MDPTEQLEQVQSELLCSICYDYFIRAITLSCSHSFCFNCISVWRTSHQNCPICRSPIYTMAPSRALDNMVAALNGNQNRIQFTESTINNMQNTGDNEFQEILGTEIDNSLIHEISSEDELRASPDLIDTDYEYNASDGSSEIEDRLNYDVNSQEDDYDSVPEDDDEFYQNETDDPANVDESNVDDNEDVLSISPCPDDDYDEYEDGESDDDSLYSDYSYGALFRSIVFKHSLEYL